jgi:ubiquinone/menaquinone biosynthesis C-methylase UbiE
MIEPNKTPSGFDAPTAKPRDEGEADRWQKANYDFWQNHPMRYDWKSAVAPAEFSPEFYHEIDTRFLNDARRYMPWQHIPFEQVIPFDDLQSKDVLEIGIGCGTHAQIIAPHCKSFTGIDLTDYAVNCTAKRLPSAKLMRMDAEKMEFPDNSFDFIWSWGVIHHSSNTRQILKEMHRVLRPGGKATVMVYHRSWWHYYGRTGFFFGLLQGQLFREKSLHKVQQRNIDGAIARFYTPREWKHEIDGLFKIDCLRIYGSKAELIPLPAGKLKNLAMRLIPDPVGRFFTNRLHFGLFLVPSMTVTK